MDMETQNRDIVKECLDRGYFTEDDIIDLFVRWGLAEITDEDEEKHEEWLDNNSEVPPAFET